MARWRKIDQRMYRDEKFCSLSRPQPCGQFLWIYLLTGKHAGIIPGLFETGEHALAEQLGWPVDAMRDAIRDVLRHGMAKADWKAGLVWIPNAIKYNPPTGPNTIISWREAWDELPECRLKLEAWQALKAFTDGMSDAFKDAFAKACPMPSLMPSSIQEQEQEQEQEEEVPASPGQQPVRLVDPPKKARKPRKPSRQELFYAWANRKRDEAFQDALPDQAWSVSRINSQLKPLMAAEEKLISLAYFEFLESEKWSQENPPCPMWVFAQDWAKFMGQVMRDSA